MKKSYLLLFGLMLALNGFTQSEDIVIDESTQAETIEQVIPIDLVWAGHPVGFALLTDHGRQYIAYYNAARHMTVGQRDLSQDRFELHVLPPKERTSREGTSTILGWDSHNSVTIAIDQDGYIHLSGNMHVNGLTYFRSTKPRDITTLVQIPEMVGKDEKRCTYPQFMKTADGTLIFRYRDGSSGSGNDIYNVYSCSTKQWSRLVDTPMTDGQGLMNAYASQPQLRSDGWYHLYWVWRDTPDCSTNHDLSYMKSPDMKQWFDVYGRFIQLPATIDQKSLIVDPIPPQGGIINLAARLCFDENNNPIFAYHKYDPTGNLQFYVARFNSDRWAVKKITDWNYRWYFSGGGSINNEVRLGAFNRREDGFYELEFSHIKYGDGTFLLNEDLDICGRVIKPAPLSRAMKPEDDFPGLLVQISNDLGGNPDPGVRYVLKWETLPPNRDQPRPKPWPEPSRLYLYQLRQPAKNWQDLKTAKDVLQAYPDRMKTLLSSLDLNREGLQDVKRAYERGDLVSACQFLLKYYGEGKTAKALRRELPPVSDRTDPEADSILQNIFTFYNQPDRVPKRDDGHLQWAHQGPDKDIEWAWGLNRHYHIRTLLDAYFKTGNPKYAEKIDRDIRDWVTSSLPYPSVRSSTAMWRGLEVSFRAKAWALVFYNLIHFEGLSPATRLLLLSSLPEHAHYARNFHAQGNWLTMEMTGLATVATAWPEFRESPAWLSYAKETMTESLKEQLYPDGVQTELTAHYHYVALSNFDQFLHICRQAEEPLPPDFVREIEKMWNYLAYSMRPDGSNVLNNDSDRRNYQTLVSNAASLYQREDWRYIATNGKAGTKPTGPPSIVFPWAGQHLMRSDYGQDAQWAFFDIGPWGSGHQHNDKLHLSISAHGRDLLVDGGRFAYRGSFADKFRRYAVGSQSHNVVLLDGQGQGPGPKVASEPLGPEHYKITDRFDYSWGSFDQFEKLEGKAEHTRALFYERGKFWIVVDRIATDRQRRIETLWHWHPDCTVAVSDGNVLSTTNERGNLSIIPVGDQKWRISLSKGQETPEPQGWYSVEYNKAEPNVANIYTTDIDQNAAFAWVLYPAEEKMPKVRAKILSQTSEGLIIQVKSQEGRWKVFVPFSDSGKVGYR